MSADKTVGEEKEGRKPRRSLLAPQKTTDPKTTRSAAASGRARLVSTASKKPVATKDEDEETPEKPREGNIVTRVVEDLRSYAEGVRSELRKVTWPTRDETRRLTIIVLIALIASSLLLGLTVWLFTQLFALGLDNPVILIVFMLAVGAAGFIVYRMQNRPSGYQRPR